MRYFLSPDCALKRLEKPCVYNIKKDELYELDEEAFNFLAKCSSQERCGAERGEFIDFCLEEGILTFEKVKSRAALSGQSASPSLRYLELQITRRCNLKCRHCYIGPSDGMELPVNEILGVLDEFQRMQGLRVLITGGEPVLHRDFEKINKALPEYAIRKILFTNGTLLDKKVIKGLNFEEMQISLDGLEEAHDSLRGKGAFRKAFSCIENSLDAGLEVSVSTMVHPKAMGDFDEMESLFKRIGIKDWTVDIPCREGYLKDNPSFQLKPEEAGRFLGCGFGEGGLHAGAEGFACGLHLMSVQADGRCAKCAFYTDRPVGNIKDGLPECWAGVKPIEMTSLECDCKFTDSCRGGCRYRAESFGSPIGKDLYRCAYYGII